MQATSLHRTSPGPPCSTPARLHWQNIHTALLQSLIFARKRCHQCWSSWLGVLARIPFEGQCQHHSTRDHAKSPSPPEQGSDTETRVFSKQNQAPKGPCGPLFPLGFNPGPSFSLRLDPKMSAFGLHFSLPQIRLRPFCFGKKEQLGALDLFGDCGTYTSGDRMDLRADPWEKEFIWGPSGKLALLR